MILFVCCNDFTHAKKRIWETVLNDLKGRGFLRSAEIISSLVCMGCPMPVLQLPAYVQIVLCAYFPQTNL